MNASLFVRAAELAATANTLLGESKQTDAQINIEIFESLRQLKLDAMHLQWDVKNAIENGTTVGDHANDTPYYWSCPISFAKTSIDVALETLADIPDVREWTLGSSRKPVPFYCGESIPDTYNYDRAVQVMRYRNALRDATVQLLDFAVWIKARNI